MAEAGTVTIHASTMSRTVIPRTVLTAFNTPMPMMAELLSRGSDTRRAE